MLGVDRVGLFCWRGHLQTREIKGNQGKSREIKGNQGKSREIKRSQEESRGVKGINVNREKTRVVKSSQGDQCEPRKNEMK